MGIEPRDWLELLVPLTTELCTTTKPLALTIFYWYLFLAEARLFWGVFSGEVVTKLNLPWCSCSSSVALSLCKQSRIVSNIGRRVCARTRQWTALFPVLHHSYHHLQCEWFGEPQYRHNCKTSVSLLALWKLKVAGKQARSNCRYATGNLWFCITGTFINISTEYFVRHPECKTEEGLQ